MSLIPAKEMSGSEFRSHMTAIKADVEDIRWRLLAIHEAAGWTAGGYSSWAACVQAELPAHRSYLYRQLQAAIIEMEVIEPINNRLSPKGDKQTPMGPIPETHLRPLALLPPGNRKEAWTQAVQTAPNGKVTARHVETVVDEMIERVETRATIAGHFTPSNPLPGQASFLSDDEAEAEDDVESPAERAARLLATWQANHMKLVGYVGAVRDAGGLESIAAASGWSRSQRRMIANSLTNIHEAIGGWIAILREDES